MVVLALVAVVGLGFLVSRLVDGADGVADGSGDTVGEAEDLAIDCDEPTRLDVVTDPAISAAVSSLLQDMECVDAHVSAQASDLTADTISRGEGVGLGGSLPDVWIPSSSMWTAQAGSTEPGAARLTGEAVSLASSPVVLAATPETATELGWPDTGAAWAELVEGGSVRVASGDPRSDASALSALVAATGGNPSPEVVAAVSTQVAVPAAQGRSPAQMILEDAADVMPTSELDVIRTQESSGGGGSLTAAYDEALGSLDFPLVTIESGRGIAEDVISAVTARLQSGEAVEALSELGLRTTEGDLGDRYGEGFGIRADAAAAGPSAPAAAVSAAVDSWAVAGRRARILLVIDRSGSMLNPMPAGTVPKSALARDSVVQVVGSASPDTEVGLWSFTTNHGDAFIQQLVPLAALSSQSTGASQRDRLASGVAGIAPIPTGDTPLFQVILDAYEEAQRNYSWGRLNAVVVVTDGKNDHPGATLTEEQTLDQLRLLYDGMRPVRILALGYGPETDLAGLTRLADVTGGLAFQGLTEQDAATLLARTLPQL